MRSEYRATFLLLTWCLLVPLSVHAFKFPGTPSTTDYLVRFQSLAYLTDLQSTKKELQRRINEAKREIGDANHWTTEEITRLNNDIIEASEEIAKLTESSSELIQLIKLEKERGKERLSGNITNAQNTIRELRNPTLKTQIITGVINTAKSFLYTRDEHAERQSQEEYARKLDQDIAFWQLGINKIEAALKNPEVLKEEAKQRIAAKLIQWEDLIEDTKTELAELKEQAGILKLETSVARNQARIQSIDRTAKCMVELAKCKSLKSWEDFSEAGTKTCRVDFLNRAKKKAKNTKCANLYSESHWARIDDCIPEYRAEILKKAGTEGSRREFDRCRRL